MVSSVRRGLAAERDAVRPVIEILGYEPVRFEDFTAQPVPPRSVCVDAAKRSDIYLLLLGEHYGEPTPDTGLAPTAEEWSVARSHGKPIVVFKKAGITPEAPQAAFIADVESYESGVFRGTFAGTADLLGKLKDALSAAAAGLQPLRPRSLHESLSVPWRSDGQSARLYSAGVVLETHVVPVGSVDRLRASQYAEASRLLARVARDHGLFDEGEALTFPTSETRVGAEARPNGRRGEAGISLTTSRAVSVWEALPSHVGGAIFDEGQIRSRIARDLRLAASVGLAGAEEAGIAVGLNRVDMLGERSGRDAMTFPFFGTGQAPLHVEPIDAVPTAALGRAADEIATELFARLVLRLRRPR